MSPLVAGLYVIHPLLVFALVTAGVLLVETAGWTGLESYPLALLTLATSGASIAATIAVCLGYHPRMRRSATFWLAGAVAALITPAAVWLESTVDSQSSVSLTNTAAVMLLAYCLNLEPVLDADQGWDVLLTIAIALVEISIIGWAYWYLADTLSDPGAEYLVSEQAVLEMMVLFSGLALALAIVSGHRMWTRSSFKWSRKETATLTISLVALCVSVASFAYPIVTDAGTKRTTAERYLSFLSAGTASSARAAELSAEPGSAAAIFAQRVNWIYLGSRVTVDASDVRPYGLTEVKFNYCFPTLAPATKSSFCVVADNFVFSATGKVMDMTLNGYPASVFLESRDLSESEWAHLSAADPDLVEFAHRGTLLNRMNDEPVWSIILLVASSDPERFELVRATITDPEGEIHELAWTPVSLEVSEYSYRWVFTSPSADGDLELCFDDKLTVSERCFGSFILD